MSTSVAVREMYKENISTEHMSGDDIKFKTQINISNGNNSTFRKDGTEQERSHKEMQVSAEVAPSVGNVSETDALEKSTEKVRKRIKTENNTIDNNYNSNGSLNTLAENIQEKANLLRDVVQALLVRVFLFVHSCLCVWRAADVQKDDIYWLLAFTNILLGIEAFYTCFFRKGRDPKWYVLIALSLSLSACP